MIKTKLKITRNFLIVNIIAESVLEKYRQDTDMFIDEIKLRRMDFKPII